MVYVAISLVSLMLLSASVALIGYIVGTDLDRIIDALRGRPITRRVHARSMVRMLAPVRTGPRHPLALRAAS